MTAQKDNVLTAIKMSLTIIRMYDWLINLYVLDFFVDNHWDKLPPLWQECFTKLDPQDLGKLLKGHPIKHVLPLSLLAIVNSVKALSLPRAQCCFLKNQKNVELLLNLDKCGNHPRLKNLFLKHVKLKKRHEIDLIASLVHNIAIKSNCNTVVDVGSGLGHLIRVLGYKYDFHTIGIECQSQLLVEARKLDMELEYTAKKHLSTEAMTKLKRPSHFNVMLSSEDNLHQLPLPNAVSYGLVGLHPCGDLGPLLLKHFVACERVKFISVVGCCFMKLTCEGESCGYPMSNYVKGLDSTLSYVSREIACHAVEVYCDRLMKGDYKDLKVHAYRAALERILIDHNPKLKHSPIRSIKHTDTMTFESYCQAALGRLSMSVTTAECARGAADLAHWKRVVIVYTLRLAFAPLLETVILLDRMLYIIENGFACEIHPVFDPKLSPRNHVLVGRRM